MFARFLLAGFAFGTSLFSGAYAEEMNSIASVGGRYFAHRVEIAVPAFAQDDPRWGGIRLGVSTDTLGDEGCAVTSGAMVAAFYGVKTDPNLLDDFLTRTGGLDKEGYIDWNKVPAIEPSRFKLIYNGSASYQLIDASLLSGNPVIVVIPLPDGAYHFVVIVGKKGRDYLIRDPAAADRPYPLRQLTNKIGDICIFRAVHAARAD
jgi:hypothetical protein